MNRLAKSMKYIGDAVLILVVILLIIATFVTVSARMNGSMGPSLFGFQMGRVVTGSMEPEIPVGSLVVAKTVPVDELVVGDDIMFMSEDPAVPSGAPVTHRIVAVTETDTGDLTFTTQGIANDIEDSYPVYEPQIIGRVVWVSEIVGDAMSWFQQPWIYPVLIGILALDLIWNVVVVAKLSLDDAVDSKE